MRVSAARRSSVKNIQAWRILDLKGERWREKDWRFSCYLGREMGLLSGSLQGEKD